MLGVVWRLINFLFRGLLPAWSSESLQLGQQLLWEGLAPFFSLQTSSSVCAIDKLYCLPGLWNWCCRCSHLPGLDSIGLSLSWCTLQENFRSVCRVRSCAEVVCYLILSPLAVLEGTVIRLKRMAPPGESDALVVHLVQVG